ncbi:Dehydrogenase E1 component superfamily [Verrucomicrobiia bacterium DG1235]|nr:Dehydrogenase E1 component superfamily [Verrucomicrobiae bacterium DG1235]
MNEEYSSKSLGILSDPTACREPINLKNQSRESLISNLELLVLIRKAEEKIADNVENGRIKCPCHLAIGQEAPAIGIAAHIQKGDAVFGAHRSHAHYLALGGDLRELFAEILGKETGCSKGMGGSMHLRSLKNQLYGTVPIVGATIPIATGAALAHKLDGNDSIAVSFLGDGAVEEGVLHESLNLASTMNLPVIYVVENNLFASHLHIGLRQPNDSTCRFAEAHNIKWSRIDGNDTVKLIETTGTAINCARSNGGPHFIEAVTYRWRGHVGHREDNDVGVKRSDDLEGWKKRDPIDRLARALFDDGAYTQNELDTAKLEIDRKIEAAWQQAEEDRYPLKGELFRRVYA